MKRKTLSILVILAAAFGAISCSGSGGNNETGIVVVNAPIAGKIRRVLVKEGTDVVENTSIIEITVASQFPTPQASETPSRQTGRNVQAEIRSAEDELQRASVELQRVEPLVASNSAPQAHLDTARAQYQQAQERVDQLRRGIQNAPVDYSRQPENANVLNKAAPRENIVPVSAPVAGSVRVISVRAGQTVKAGDPVATISTTR